MDGLSEDGKKMKDLLQKSIEEGQVPTIAADRQGGYLAPRLQFQVEKEDSEEDVEEEVEEDKDGNDQEDEDDDQMRYLFEANDEEITNPPPGSYILPAGSKRDASNAGL